MTAEAFGRAVRAHWGIENRSHHVRDRILGEDASRIRCRPGVFARLRSFALNILRARGVTNVSEAVYTNALSLDRLLAYGQQISENSTALPFSRFKLIASSGAEAKNTTTAENTLRDVHRFAEVVVTGARRDTAPRRARCWSPTWRQPRGYAAWARSPAST